MKRLSLVLFSVPFVVCCAGKIDPGGHIKPGIRMRSPAIVYVDKPWILQVFLFGDFPQIPIGVEVRAGSRQIRIPFVISTANTLETRVYYYRIKFNHDFYFQMESEAIGDSMHLFRTPDAECGTDFCPWDGFVQIEVRVRRLELKPDGTQELGRLIKSASRRIKLDCWNCTPVRPRPPWNLLDSTGCLG